MLSEDKRFAVSNAILLISIGLLAFVFINSNTGCVQGASGSCQIGDKEVFGDSVEVGGSVILEGATANDHETTLSVVDPTADRVVNIPNVSGYIPVPVDEGTAGKVLTSGGANANATWQNSGGGISVAETFRLTSDITAAGTFYAPGSELWEADDTTTYSKVGSSSIVKSFSPSSPHAFNGEVWTFGETGIYLIDVTCQLASDNNNYYGSRIYAYTTNDQFATTFERLRISKSYRATASGGPVSPDNKDTISGSFLFDVENTTTHKLGLQFYFDQNTSCEGSTTANNTFVQFLKLGDT